MDKWFVSRQHYWGVEEGEDLVVEIAYGGVDYANPDMLSDPGNVYYKLGSGQEYTDPREALAAALAVREEWRKRMPEDTIRIETGCTSGNTIPFMGFPDDDDLKKWADDSWETLPKCDVCGGVRHETYHLAEDPFGSAFCSENCANKAWDVRHEDDAFCETCGDLVEGYNPATDGEWPYCSEICRELDTE